jgi:hypothetical protein
MFPTASFLDRRRVFGVRQKEQLIFSFFLKSFSGGDDLNLLRNEFIVELTATRTVEEVTALAMRDLASLPPPASVVCGRLRTGGGHFEENRRVMRKAISFVRRRKRETVFDQLLYLGRIDRLPDARWRLRIPFVRHYFLRRRRRMVREKFHLPLLRSGLIRKLIFLPGWEGSKESRWYFNRAVELGIEIDYLQEEDLA